MTFGATDLSNTTVGTNQVPVSAVYVPGTAGSNLTAVEGIAVNTDSNSQKSSGMRVGLKDGDDVTQGATTDAAVTGDVSGSLSAKLRGLSKLFNAIIGATGAAVPASASQIGGSDGVNLRAITVTQAHNADNQTPPATGYGILVNTNAGVFNAAGTVDRARGTGFDGVPAVGIPAGAQQLTGPALSTTFNGAVTGSGSAQSVVVVSSANAKIGDILVTQDNVEYVEITAIADATHVTGIFKNNHASGQSLTWYHYNQARDATIGDAISNLAGISPSATYLWNNVNSTMEYDRSANGERDGASGVGTPVAVTYESNGNIPANGPVLSGLQFDRARNVQAGGLGSGTISNNPLAANSTTLTLNAAPTTLDKGIQIILDRTGANPETNVVGTGYVLGSTSVPLQIATQFSHAQNATVEWSQHSPLGPQLNGFLPSGLGMEEEIVFDPLSKKYFVEISATADANSGQNIVGESEMLWNGATFDRARSVSIGDGAAATGIGADGIMLYNGATFDRLRGTSGAVNADVIDRWARQAGQIDIARVLGAAMSLSNPLIMQPQGIAAALGGKLYSAAVRASNTSAYFAFSLFNPNTAKTIIIVSVRVSTELANLATPTGIITTTANPSYANSVTPVNHLGGGAASSASVTWGTTQGAPTFNYYTNWLSTNAGHDQGGELIPKDYPHVLPASANNGLSVFSNSGAVEVTVDVTWIEY